MKLALIALPVVALTTMSVAQAHILSITNAGKTSQVIVREDAACVIPARFVSVWNSANRAELPTFANQLDAAPSGVALSDVAAQHEREAELCLRNTEQLKALQAAELERQRVMEAAK